MFFLIQFQPLLKPIWSYLTEIDCLSFQQEIRDGPFNFQGGGGYVFFLNKYSDSQCYWKKYSDFGGGKKKSVSEFLSYNLMLNFGERKIALCATKNKYYNSHAVRENFSEWSKKP